MADFPGMFSVSIFAVGSSFLVAYGATSAAIAIRSRSYGRFGWTQVLNLFIGIAGLIIGVLGYIDNAGTSLEEKTVARTEMPIVDSAQPVQDPCLSEQIVADVEITCELSPEDSKLPDGTPYRAFRYNGAKGEQITISMYAEDFDAVLILGTGDITADSFEFLDVNDDGGIGLGTDSRLKYTFTEDGTYTVVANSLAPGATGIYRVYIESEK